MTVLLLLAALTGPALDSESQDHLPRETVAWFETSDHVPLLEQGLEHPLVEALLTHPLVQESLDRDGFDPAEALAGAEALLGESPLRVALGLSSQSLGIGLLAPGGGTDLRVFAVLRGRSPDTAESSAETLYDALRTIGIVRPLRADQVRVLGPRIDGAWRIAGGGGFAATTRSGALLIAQTVEDLAACNAGGSGPEGLLQARADMPSDARTFAWVDLVDLDARGRLGDLREAVAAPAAHFLFGPALTYAASGNDFAASVRFHRTGIDVQARASGVDAAAGAVTFPSKQDDRTGYPDAAPDAVVHMRVHRDVARLVRERTELFEPRALPKFAEALGNLALLLGGDEAVDEFIDAICPQMLLVAEPVTYGDSATPDIPLPGACLVARLRDAEAHGPRLLRAFQTAMALNAVERAQNGRPGYLLGMTPIDDVVMYTAELPLPAEGDGVDLAYNLAPACVVVDGFALLGTHHDLVARMARRVRQDREVRGATGLVDDLQVRGGALAALIEANRDLLVMKTVLKEGKSRTRAALEVDTLQDLVAGLDRLRLTTSATNGRSRTITARLRFDLAR